MTEVATKVIANTYRFNNQTFYAETVGTYLIELEAEITLFDLPSFNDQTKKFIKSFNKPAKCFLSHGSCGISDGTKWQKEIGLNVYLNKKDKDSRWLMMKPDVLYNELPQLSERLKIIETPGHTKGSVCLLDKKTKTLFTGDTIYGNKNGEIRDFMELEREPGDNIRLVSCKKLVEYNFENILPFHYEMILGNAKGSLKEFVNKY